MSFSSTRAGAQRQHERFQGHRAQWCRPCVEQLHKFLGEIHKASGGLPIVYYNIPAASGLSPTPADIAGLADVGVKHLKDMSGNRLALVELK
ncbi:Dihydrodipicolinate synthase [Diaporthe eres]|nr:Dihydrodipicolinate synthase [Diaporthe eres]